MLCEMFPMSKAEYIPNITKKEFIKSLDLYCCLFDIKLYDVESKVLFESYISESRCNSVNAVVNNGRIVSADGITMTVTEIDYKLICEMYDFNKKKVKISNFRRYKKAYLPKDFIIAILELYGKKTTLKGVEGMEAEYMNGKADLNSTFGMTCTDIVRDIITYTSEWDKETPDLDVEIDKYNKSSSRFMFFPWGVWVVAYARRNLFTGILEFGRTGDYVYADTDSVKVLNASKHMKYINKYNDIIVKKLIRAMDFHNLPHELIKPKTIKGVEKPLGVWDFDGHYSIFKTEGAKRYMVQYSLDPRNKNEAGHINLTVSGLNKKVCMPYLLKKYGREKVFEMFNEDLYIPSSETGKLTHSYIDEEVEGTVVDYNGVEYNYHELSGVHLEPASYKMKLAPKYLDYLMGLQDL